MKLKPLFTIHEGEFLVGDHISRMPGRKFDVWVPTKDRGVDLLVTRKNRTGRAVGLQVKFSRSFSHPDEMARDVLATSWFTLEPKKIRASQADIWVFAIMTLRHEKHFVLIPTSQLRKCIPRNCGKIWHLYIWAYADGSCYQVRGLPKREKLDTVHADVRDVRRNFTAWLGNWKLLDRFTKKAR
ncbi:hypothetical protein PLCT2_00550 [Planctomycetaceae bacterium]|nr:hypothetical protein PLCT2_00550 [Planctomycetaceae bacterium]